MNPNRRNFLKTMSAIPFIPILGKRNDWKDFPGDFNKVTGISLPKTGSIRIKTPKEFDISPFGIGCETLDRELWDPKEIYPHMDKLSVKWARLQSGWERVEKKKGVYDWEWLDESIDGLIIRGFKPFLMVGYGNSNYLKNYRDHPLNNEEAYAAWKKFIKLVATRYKRKIRYYEIWNEPNHTGGWLPGKPEPEEYVKLVRDTGRIIRKNCPGAVIIAGVLSTLPFVYTRSLFESGLGKEIDIFSFHPYAVIPETYADQVRVLRKFIDRYNPDIKIWQGECGYPSEPRSSGYHGEPPWTEIIQAKIMLRRLLTDCSLDLDMSLWFLIVDLHDYPKGSGDVNYKGILRTMPRVEPKIAFSALQNLGSTVYGNVHVRNAVIHCSSESREEDVAAKYKRLYESGAGLGLELTVANVYTTMLNNGAGKILAYWDTARAADHFPPVNIDMLLSDWEGNGFNEPVLVDPMDGNIYDLSRTVTRKDDNAKWSSTHETQFYQRLPLRDYPLLITEKSSVMSK